MSLNYGAIFENWVFGELRKLLTLKPMFKLYFYRSHTNKEVDFVIENACILYA